MFEKKLPNCVSLAAVSGITVPSLLGVVVKLALNTSKIIKAAKEVKTGIDNLKTMATELSNQQITPQEVIEEEVNQV